MVQYVDDVDHLMANQLTAFFHCAQCLAACPPDMSPAEFTRLAVGRTPYGLQVWCVRHNLNVYHLDLTSTTRPRCVTHGVETCDNQLQSPMRRPKCHYTAGSIYTQMIV